MRCRPLRVAALIVVLAADEAAVAADSAGKEVVPGTACVGSSQESAGGAPLCAGEACQASYPDEALLSEVTLLQTELRRSRRSQTSSVNSVKRDTGGALSLVTSLALLGKAAAHPRFGDASVLAGFSAEGAAGPKADTESPTMDSIVAAIKANADKDESDGFWLTAFAAIRSGAESMEETGEFMRLCSAKRLEDYLKKGCDPHSGGSKLTASGLAKDTYFCGSVKAGIDWSKLPSGRNDICGAAPNTAYEPGGTCGTSKKQLILNLASSVPQWEKDSLQLNVPSVDCILGLGDCDIYYCQHCPGRCD